MKTSLRLVSSAETLSAAELSPDALEALTVVRLKSLLRTEELPVSGRKTVLVHRLLDAVSGAPRWLPEEGRREWRRVTEIMSARWPGKHNDLDQAALAGYCMSWSVFVEVSKIVVRDGSVIEGRNKQGKSRVKHPAVQVMRDAQKEIRSWCKELGFTPTARMRLGFDETPAEDKARRLISQS